MADEPNIKLREPLESDLRFVRSSWFESYRKGGYAPDVGFDIYKAGHGALIGALVPGPFIAVAYASAEPDEICGWICADPVIGTIHYVYVKHAYRRMGIALRLCNLYEVRYFSHATRAGLRLAAKLGIKFNPYSLFNITPEKG
jgi:GNAT superfamily N-acetyltransferase